VATRTDRRHRRRLSAPVLAALLLVAGFVALLGYGLAATEPDDTINDQLAAGRSAPAPGFDLPVLSHGSRNNPRLARALADGRLALGELRGMPVVVNFWASWCPPCRTEAPRLERAWLADSRDGVAFVGLNMQDVTDDARAFMEEFEVSYPNVRDGSDAVARDWGVTALPETFFVDQRGRVVGHVIGAIDSRQLRGGVRAAVRGLPIGSLQGGDRRGTR
jgi:cytochrome c biogenesis protein CcmG, thiol:disulfide interchange protein DsbE